MQFMKYVKLLLCIFMVFIIPYENVSAETGDIQTPDSEYVSYTETPPDFLATAPFFNKKGKSYIYFSQVYLDESDAAVSLNYEVQISKKKNFENATSTVTSDNFYILTKDSLSKNGGTYYLRVRTQITTPNKTLLYSDWSKVNAYTYLAINKKNFPGLHTLLKKGGEYYSTKGVKKETYDKNKDGWLDPLDIQQLTSLSTVSKSKKKNGKYVFTITANVNNLTGVQYFENLHSINLAKYSGKKMNLFKNKKLSHVSVRSLTKNTFTLNAPSAKYVHIESGYKNSLKKMDISACKNAVEITAYGNNTKTLKLPKKAKKLSIISLSDINIKTINLNTYKKLQQIYLYQCNLNKLQINKCKQLRYLYFYFCNKISSVDVTANKKLRGASSYSCNKLTYGSIKVPKGAKVTYGEGKWWYSTSAYKKDMKKIYSMY